MARNNVKPCYGKVYMPNDYYRLLVPLFLHAMPHLLQTYATVLLLGRENYYEYIKQVNFILLSVWTGLITFI
jgi:hypothetical protein